MKVIVQRVSKAKCTVNNKVTGAIQNGFMLLVGFTNGDNLDTISYMVKKIINLRIMDDENNVMNKSILDTGGSILSISQFTLYADTKKGNRPSYINALNNSEAKILYEKFNDELKRYVSVQEGVFGEDMEISLVNSGPTTIILER